MVFPGEEFKFYMSVLIEEGWHIYSLLPLKGSELLATKILIDKNVFQEKEGWREPGSMLIQDGAVGKIVKGHKGNVEFSRTYIVPFEVDAGTYPLNGRLVYRACDNQVCTLPQEFLFNTVLQVSSK